MSGNSSREEDFGSCLSQRATCRLCQAFEAAWSLSVDCDSVDNGLAEGSCD